MTDMNVGMSVTGGIATNKQLNEMTLGGDNGSVTSAIDSPEAWLAVGMPIDFSEADIRYEPRLVGSILWDRQVINDTDGNSVTDTGKIEAAGAISLDQAVLFTLYENPFGYYLSIGPKIGIGILLGNPQLMLYSPGRATTNVYAAKWSQHFAQSDDVQPTLFATLGIECDLGSRLPDFGVRTFFAINAGIAAAYVHKSDDGEVFAIPETYFINFAVGVGFDVIFSDKAL